MRERDVEKYLVQQVRKAGGRAYKWVSPGNPGVPDRVVVLPRGRVWFVEMKAPGRKPTRLQQAVIDFLTALNANVAVLDSKEAVDGWLRNREKEAEQ